MEGDVADDEENDGLLSHEDEAGDASLARAQFDRAEHLVRALSFRSGDTAIRRSR